MNTSSPSSAPAAAQSVTLPAPKIDATSLAILLVIGATVFFSAGDVAAKMLTAHLPASEVTWLRYLIFALLAVPFALYKGGHKALTTSHPWKQIIRAFAVVGSSLLFITSLSYLDVSKATAINFISPIFMMALSVVMLGELVGIRRWCAAAVSFAGVLVIVQPGTDAFTLAALLPIASAFCWALSGIVTRSMGSERAETTMVWSAVIGLILLSALLPFDWKTPTWEQMSIALALGVLSTAGNWLVILAFRQAPASVVAPFFYVQLLSAAVFSYLVFHVVPGVWTLAGGAVIAGSGLYVAHRERVRKREAVMAASASR